MGTGTLTDLTACASQVPQADGIWLTEQGVEADDGIDEGTKPYPPARTNLLRAIAKRKSFKAFADRLVRAPLWKARGKAFFSYPWKGAGRFNGGVFVGQQSADGAGPDMSERFFDDVLFDSLKTLFQGHRQAGL